MMGAILRRTIINPLPALAVLAVSGCWTPPVADVQPKSDPRLVQSGIVVESVKDSATVQSVDPATRTVVLISGKAEPYSYKVGRQVENFDRLKAGDKVRATVAEVLTIYVSHDGRVPAPDGKLETISSDARVLLVDPSYRLLTVRYPNGLDETFKVGLEVRLREMEPGDDVVIRPLEARALEVQRR
jgi:hypothetical protein